MKPGNPVFTQAISIGTFIALVKAILAFLLAFHVFNFDADQNSTVNVLVDIAVPVLSVFAGAWWASRKVTSLAAPRDSDGAPLSRPDSTPAIAELESKHEEALKINQSVDKGADDRRIKRDAGTR